MSESVTFDDDDDTARLRLAAAKAPSSDPAREMTGLEVAFIAHEQADQRRFAAATEDAAARERANEQRRKQWGFALGLLLALAGWGAEQAWAAHADAAAGRAQIDDMHERVVRIEQQIDRLMERSDR